MSRKDGVLLVSRAVAIYLLGWALVGLTYIPENLFAFLHHASLSALQSENYFRNYDFIRVAFLFIRTVVLFVAANWFYNCGARVESFFLDGVDDQNQA